jgi:DNA uptake protein ComE-like DNA-binding protein
MFAFDPNTVDAEILDSLDIPEFIKRNIISYRKAGGRFLSLQDVRKIYGMNDSIFSVLEKYIVIAEKTDSETKTLNVDKGIKGFIDPNKADFSQLIEFGFNRFQANNIIEYRKSNGSFKTQTDLMKIYGIDSSFVRLIENHIRFENKEELAIAGFKPAVVKVELNSADSTELMKLNGIGSVYATRILKYRDLLGGFYSASQLLEVYNFPEETFKNIENNISADTLLIKKIRINFAEYADLLRHPYLNKKQVEAVLNYRDKNGSFQNVLQLKTNGLIDSETFSRISPYFTCR